jgi:Fe-Mn family superoxide dismutase
MLLHHSKHHQNYVNGLNDAEEALAKLSAEGDTTGVIALQQALQFNLGGHVCVSLPGV